MNVKITVYAFKQLKLRPQCPAMPHILFSFLYLHFNSVFPSQSTWKDTVPRICFQDIQETVLSKYVDFV